MELKHRHINYYIGGAVNAERMGISTLLIGEGDIELRRFIYKKADTTEPRMKISALILALQTINKNNKIDSTTYNTITIDDRYIANVIRYWLVGWVEFGWKTRNNTIVKNKDLWEVFHKEVAITRAKTILKFIYVYEEITTMDSWRIKVYNLTHEKLKEL